MGFIGILQVPMGDCLVGDHLVCGLVMCPVWLCCPCHVLGWAEYWRASCDVMSVDDSCDESDGDFQ